MEVKVNFDNKSVTHEDVTLSFDPWKMALAAAVAYSQQTNETIDDSINGIDVYVSDNIVELMKLFGLSDQEAQSIFDNCDAIYEQIVGPLVNEILNCYHETFDRVKNLK